MCVHLYCQAVVKVCVYIFLQANAEVAVRDMLRDAARTARSVTGRCQLTAADNMDDGSIISLTVGLDESEVCCPPFYCVSVNCYDAFCH